MGTTKPKLDEIPAGATRDGFDTQGNGELRADGSAHLELVQTFSGKLAIVLRNVLAQEPPSQLRSFVEGRLFGRALKGSRVLSLEFQHKDDLDRPLVLKVSVEVPAVAQVRGNEIVLAPPFTPNLSQLAAAATRTTPLVVPESSEQSLTLRLTLPKGATTRTPSPRTMRLGDREVALADRTEPNVLVLDRSVRMPAGRVPTEQYQEFADYVRNVSDALSSQITIRLGAAL